MYYLGLMLVYNVSASNQDELYVMKQVKDLSGQYSNKRYGIV